MTVESAFKQGKFLSVPADMVSSIGRSTKHDGCGVVTMKGGSVFVTSESFRELAQMVAEDAEMELSRRRTH